EPCAVKVARTVLMGLGGGNTPWLPGVANSTLSQATKTFVGDKKMALYHFSAKVFSRSSRNTVNAIAYRAGCKLYDERTGQTFNYQKKDVQHVELVLPKDAPLWVTEIQKLIAEDRQKGVQAFCNIVEGAEKRIDAQVWREFEFALHRELTDEQNITLARAFMA
ncbi:MAG: MobA/MobL family protein, partial [Alphaproteobacteria bacterium]|nr:MobA/MobL family protein [Alphaproteobacteria bacterium]